MKSHRSRSFSRRAAWFAALLAVLGSHNPKAAGQNLNVQLGNTHNVSTNETWNNVDVGNNGTGTINQTAGVFTVAGSLQLGLQSGSNGIYNLSGGSVSVSGTFGVFVNLGTFNQTGGSVTVNSTDVFLASNLGTATYNLSGANSTLSSRKIYVGNGGTATFNLNGGTVTTGQILVSGSTGTLNLNGGTLRPNGNGSDSNFINVSRANIRNGGVKIDTNGISTGISRPLSHSDIGGDNAIDGGLTKLGAGTLTLSGVNTYTGNTVVNGGTLNITGGSTGVSSATFTVNGPAASAPAVNLYGPGVVNANALRISEDGAGSFAQSSGTVNVSLLNLADLANSTANYDLFGGTLNAQNIFVGVGGAATFTQGFRTSDVTATGQIVLGSASTGTGTYSISDGTLSTPSLIVGSGGGTGTFNLDGGTVTAAGVTRGANSTGTFNLNGGTLQASASSTTFFRGLTAANVRDGGARFDTNGFNLTVAQPLVHSTIGGDAAKDGGLNKIGAGTLTLTGANTYTGTTNISAGTLAISSGSVGLANSSADFYVYGYAVDAPTANLSGTGSLRSNTLLVGYTNGTGTFNLSGGSVSANDIEIAAGGGSGVFNQTGGSATANGGNLVLATGSGATGAYNLSGANSALSAGAVYLGNGGGAGTFNLDGGMLTTGQLVTPSDSTGTFNFNGGTLRPGASSTNFFEATLVNVRNGGAKIDTNGFNITVAEPLVHSTLGGDSATDGGLTKSGVGTLTLTGANTYTGVTVISAGTLQVGVGGTSGNLGTGNVTDNAALVFNRSDALNIGAVISGSGGVTQAGAGTLTFSGATANTFMGDTLVNAGTLVLAKGGAGAGNNFGSALGGNLIINSGGTARYGASSQVRDDNDILVNAGGTLNLNGFAESLTNLSVNGGGVSTGSGYLNVRGSVSADGSATSSYVGNLHLEAPTANAARDVSVASGGTFTVSAVVSNGDNGLATQLNKTGAGTLILSGNNTYTGGTTIGAGTLQVGNGGTSGSLGTGTGTITDNGTLAFNRSNNVSLGNAISGSGAVTKLGAGTLTLTGANTYTGVTVISAGTLQVGIGGTSGNLGTGNVTDNAALVFNRSDALNIGAVISGSGGVTQAGAGTLTFSGATANTFMGDTLVNAGTLVLAKGGAGAGNNFGSALGGNLIINSGGTARYGASSQVRDDNDILVNAGGTLNLNGFAESLTNLSVNGGGVSTGSGYLNVRGSVSADGSATSSYVGNLHLEAPTANAARDVSVASGGTFTVSAVVSNGDNGLATQLNKTGTGTFILSGDNTYTGGTTINAGSLSAANASGSATGTGAVTVASGGTLAGSGTIDGPVTVASGGILLPGSLATPAKLTLNNSLAMSSGSTFGVEIGGTSDGLFGQVQLNGTLTLNGMLNVTTVNGFTLAIGQSFVILDNTSNTALVNGVFANAPGGLYTNAMGDLFQINYLANADGGVVPNDILLTVVPEPSTWATVLTGAAFLALVLRARRSRLVFYWRR